MRRSILVVAALLIAAPSLGLAQASGAAKDRPAATSKSKKPAGGKAAPAAPAKGAAAAKAATSKKAKESTVNPADRVAMLRARSTFVYASDACSEGRNACNQELLEDAQQRFIEACRACAPVDSCEAARTAIRAGKPSDIATLCAP